MSKKKREPMPAPVIVFTPAYSGERSENLWAVVNRMDDMVLYVFGCALQDMESRFLRAVVDAQEAKRITWTKTSAPYVPLTSSVGTLPWTGCKKCHIDGGVWRLCKKHQPRML